MVSSASPSIVPIIVADAAAAQLIGDGIARSSTAVALGFSSFASASEIYDLCPCHIVIPGNLRLPLYGATREAVNMEREDQTQQFRGAF